MALIRVLNKATGRYEPIKPTTNSKKTLEQRVHTLEALVATLTHNQHNNYIKA